MNKHPEGGFGRIELATSDQTGAKAFYSGLFGWTYEDNPMGPSDVYTMFSLGGQIVGGAYTIRGEEASMGVPPHWNLYVAVGSADAAAKKAGE